MTEDCKGLQGITRVFRESQAVTRDDKGLQGITKVLHKGLQEVKRSYRLLQEITVD